ncbi:MAG TPA: SRPBCC family protein [Solirubrobacterales bacterium]|nr:SRPBCC family protein [Solirubrobacterales bacterium]
MSVSHAEFTIERHYRQTPAQVFSAFADPALKERWFANPGNWSDAEWEMDFRVGGGERSAGGASAGRHNEFRSRFHDIVENERIVYSYDLLHDRRLISVSLTTIELFAGAAGTRMTFTEQGAFFDGLDAAAAREHGTGKLLDLLGGFLAGESER